MFVSVPSCLREDQRVFSAVEGEVAPGGEVRQAWHIVSTSISTCLRALADLAALSLVSHHRSLLIHH